MLFKNLLIDIVKKQINLMNNFQNIFIVREFYANADIEMKRDAINSATSKLNL